MKKIMVIASAMLFGFISANAAGTAAGTTVSNTASLSYTVGGAVQPIVNTPAAATFVVDKKIDFQVSHDDSPKHLVTTPGATDQERSFTLTNESNSVQDYTLSASNLVASEVYDTKTDDADVTNFEISIDGGTTWSTGPVTVDNLAVDDNLTVLVRADVPNTNTNGQVMNIQLEATAVQDGTTTPEVVTGSGADGTLSPDRKDAVDVVLAEGAGITDFGNTAFDGKYSAWAGYIIESPTLSLTKSSCVFEDLVSGKSANAKRIPGATITYLFDIENTGAIDASDINITDSLPAQLDVTTVTAVVEDDNQTSCSCVGGVAGSGTAAAVTTGTPTAQDVQITGLTAAAGSHNCVTLQVKIK